MQRTLHFEITDNKQLTVGQYLQDQGISHKAICTLKIQENALLLNNIPCFTNKTLEKGDHLTITLNETNNLENIIPVKMELNIVYEDDDLIIIDKPKDITVHPSIKYFDCTLSNGLAYYFQNNNQDICIHCITRLDKDTTGLTLFAKNRLSANYLSQMIAGKQIEKTYYALSCGKLEYDNITVDAPIARLNKGNILRTVNFENGKKAISHFQLLKYNFQNDISLIKCLLETGRTHQIRVHLLYLGHPLIGDELYNKNNHQLDRQALHCGKLKFIHPLTKQLVEIESKLPEDMNKLI